MPLKEQEEAKLKGIRFNEAAGAYPADARASSSPGHRVPCRFNEAAGAYPADAARGRPMVCARPVGFNEAAGAYPADAPWR